MKINSKNSFTIVLFVIFIFSPLASFGRQINESVTTFNETNNENSSKAAKQDKKEEAKFNHYTLLMEALDDDAKSELVPKQILLSGPTVLVAILNSDREEQEKALFNPIFSEKNMQELFDKYGNQVYSYMTYVISDLGNIWNGRTAYNFLFEVAQQLEMKNRRGLYSLFDETGYTNGVLPELIGSIPDFDSYPPLKETLIFVLLNSQDKKSRETAAVILVMGYEGSQEIEEALIAQYLSPQATSGERSTILGAFAQLSMSADSNVGFQSEQTMPIILEALKNERNGNDFAALRAVILKFKPPEALSELVNIILTEKDQSIFTITLNMLVEYGGEAKPYLPELIRFTQQTDDFDRKQELEVAIEKIQSS